MAEHSILFSIFKQETNKGFYFSILIFLRLNQMLKAVCKAFVLCNNENNYTFNFSHFAQVRLYLLNLHVKFKLRQQPNKKEADKESHGISGKDIIRHILRTCYISIARK